MKKDLSFILNSDLNICWSGVEPDQHSGSLFDMGNSIQDVLVVNREVMNFVRWTNSKESEINIEKVNIQNCSDDFSLHAFKSNKFLHVHLSETRDNTLTNNVSEKFWDVFTQTFPGGILFIDHEKKVIEISINLIKLLDKKTSNNVAISKKSILNLKMEELFVEKNEEFFSEFQTNLDHSIQTREVVTIESEINGTPVRVLQGPVFTGKRYIGSCIYFFNISDEVENNQLIEEQKKFLNQASKLTALAEMAGGIAHEINNPISILQSETSLMLKFISKNKYSEVLFVEKLNVMLSTIKRISRIIIGMRSLSDDASDEVMKLFSLEEFKQELNGTLHNIEEKTNAEVLFEFSDGIDKLMIKGKMVQLSQVLQNLVINSTHALEGVMSPKITISIKEKSELIEFSVIDNGPGVPEDLKDKIFNPFFTTKETGKGTGIGLSLSQRIIDKHGGKLTYTREADLSTFTFKIPFEYKGESEL